MTDALHVGVIGVGRIGAFHARTLLGLRGVASIAVADADPAHAEHVARDLQAEAAPRVRAEATPEKLLESGVDAIVIAASTPAHAPMLRLAAAAGVPASCEKPVPLALHHPDQVPANL